MSASEETGPFGWTVLTVRFLLELGALAALAYWGFRTGGTAISRAGLAIGAPLVAALVWGAFVAPKAIVEVARPVRIAIELTVFAAATAALVAAGRPLLALCFGVVAAIDSTLVHEMEISEDDL